MMPAKNSSTLVRDSTTYTTMPATPARTYSRNGNANGNLADTCSSTTLPATPDKNAATMTARTIHATPDSPYLAATSQPSKPTRTSTTLPTSDSRLAKPNGTAANSTISNTTRTAAA